MSGRSWTCERKFQFRRASCHPYRMLCGRRIANPAAERVPGLPDRVPVGRLGWRTPLCLECCPEDPPERVRLVVDTAQSGLNREG